MSTAPFRLIYWSGIPGRAEPIRLVFELAGVEYEDVARKGDEADGEVMSLCTEAFKCPEGNVAPFASPALHHGKMFLSQLPNILFYLSEQLPRLRPAEDDKWRVNQVALTILDFQNETHDTHHPIAQMDWYENQTTESLRRSYDYRKNRLPKFLNYFDRVITDPSKPYLVGGKLSYADLTLWHVVEGVKYAFPNATGRILPPCKKLLALCDNVANLPQIKAYVASDRRQPFSNGLFRHYPELDVEADLERIEKEEKANARK